METDRIADQLKRVFEGDAWHGPSLSALLEGLSAQQAAAKPLPQCHSIWALCLHLHCWQQAVMQRLQGHPIEYEKEEDWPAPPAPTDAAWEESRQKLKHSYQQLHAAILQLSDQQLDAFCPGKNYSLYVLLHGLIQHTLYHAGQIALLRKLLRD